MEFKDSIQIFFDPSNVTEPIEVQLSSGTAPVNQSLSEKYNYRSGVFLPNQPWREALDSEKQILFANTSSLSNSWQLGSGVAIIKVPDEVLASFDILGLKTLNDYTEKKLIFENSNYNTIILGFVSKLSHYLVNLKDFKIFGLNIAPSGLPSITNDVSQAQPNLRQFIGLHIDENDIVPVKDKISVRNRLSVNLGRSDRYLMFINLTLVDIYCACKGYDPAPDLYYSVSELTDEFLNLYPNYPVVKLRVRPGEAYIAPAQNMIHDAYNPETNYPDITLNFIGYFDYKPNYNHNLVKHKAL